MNLLFRFNSDGTLKEFTGGNLIQSSVKSDTLYVKVDDVDVSNFVAMAEYKRPDGQVSNDIAMAYGEVPFGLGDGFRQTIPAWCTQLDGQLEITIRLLTFTSNGDKRVFAMAKNVVKVLASTSAGDGEVNITDEQYDALLETLANKSLNEVVGKDVEEYLNQKFEGKSGLIDEYLEEQTSRIENEIDTELKEMDDTIKGLGDLKPSGTAPSSSIISFKDNVGIYIGEDDGNWYYWKASEQRYVVGGVYQATEIADGSVTPKKTSFIEEESTDNLIYLEDVEETTISGITYKIKDGVITFSGTASGDINLWLPLKKPIPSGTKSMLSIYTYDSKSEGISINSLWYAKGYEDWSNRGQFQDAQTFTTNYDITYLLLFIGWNSTATNFVVKPMIVSGNVIPSEFKPISFKYTLSKDINVSNSCITPEKTTFIDKVLSDNLIYLKNKEETTINGVTYSIQNGVITLNGTATGDINLWLPLEQKIPSGTKSMLSSYTYKSSKNFNVNNFWYAKGYEDWSNRGQFQDAQTFTTEYDITLISVYIPANTSVEEYVFKPMIVSGNVIPSEFKQSVKYILNSSINLEQDLDYKSLFKLKNKYRYLTLTFYGTDSRGLILLGTNDLKTFDLVSQKGKYITLNYVENSLQNTLRDPSIIQIQDYYYIVYTIIGFETGSNKIGLCRTKDFESFEELDNLGITNVSDTYDQIWAPNWFRDGNNVYILGTCRKNGTENKVTTISKYNVNTHTLESGVELNFDGIDYHLYRENGVYYALGGGGKVYKSNQLNGEYTLVTDNSGGYEGDFAVKLDNGKWRVYRQEVEQHLGSSHIVYNDLETLESEWGEIKRVEYTPRALSYVHDLSGNSEKHEYWHWTIFDFNNINGNNNNFTD